jgi:vanillate O-demethylase monooxygenase subunit
MFPLDTWYVAARSEEIAADSPLGRTICNKPIVLHRDAQGTPVALDDFCPHRGLPLSMGIVRDGRLTCGYHGLVMGADGCTLAMPAQRVQGFPRIHSFPVIERHGLVWIWPGDATRADPALIPAYHWQGNPAWAYGGGTYHIKADYRLMIDNLMDLTHETWVHATSIGQTEIDDTPCETLVTGDEVITRRLMHGVSAPPFWNAGLGWAGLENNVPVDRWQVCRFTPPSHIMIEVGVAHAGQGGAEAAPEHKVYGIVVDFITPETDGSMWYFWGMARSFCPDDASLTEKIRAGQGAIFAEDLAVLERQQANLAAFADRRILKLDIDAGGVRSRRVIERIVAAEQALR